MVATLLKILTIKPQFSTTTYKGLNSNGLQTYKAALIKTTGEINSGPESEVFKYFPTFFTVSDIYFIGID